MTLGDYLKSLRLDRNLSAREAARRIGISYTRLQEVESGVSRTTGKPTTPKLDLLIKIAKGYDQPLPLLLEMTGLASTKVNEQQEAELLQTFRSLSSTGRDLVMSLVRAVENQEKIKPLS